MSGESSAIRRRNDCDFRTLQATLVDAAVVLRSPVVTALASYAGRSCLGQLGRRRIIYHQDRLAKRLQFIPSFAAVVLRLELISTAIALAPAVGSVAGI